MNTFKLLSQQALAALQVNTNVHLFATQWVEENGLEDLDNLFALFDRLQIPYQLMPDANMVRKQPHKVVIAVAADNSTILGRFHGQQFQAYIKGTFTKQAVPKSSFFVVIENTPIEKADPDWVGSRLHAFRPLIPKLLLVSFLTNLFALAIPFITMSIYDHVIGGDAGHELQGIAIGAALLFVMMGLLKTLRSRVFSTISNRISREISQAVIQKLLNNVYSANQQMASSTYRNQVMMSDRVASVLSGPLGNALFDIPFVLLFLIAIGILGGWLVIVPCIALLCYFLLAKRNMKGTSTRGHQSTIAGTNRENMINELSRKLVFMRSAALINNWQTRFEKANHLASSNGFRHASAQARYTSAYYAIGILSTLAIMGLGIDLIFQQIMTPGGLIASMMLISKVTSPAQMLANSAGRMQSFTQSKAQLNRMFAQASERSFSYQHHPLPQQPPAINLDQVTLRFAKQTKPALSGVTASIEAAEIVAITGPMGCGKTSLLEAIAGLQTIQNGVVELNKVNLNQYDPQLYRHWCFFRAAYPDSLLLSIREWLDDGHHLEQDKMIAAIQQVGGQQWLDSLPNGLDTQLSDAIPNSMFDILARVEAQILIKAKAYVHDYPLYLLDNPLPDNAPQSKAEFEQFLTLKRGKATVIFTSFDPEIIKLADKVIILDEGAVVYAGPLQTEQPDNSPEQNNG
jgi:ATP-binding cassette subfamily C protein LapB